MSKARAFDHIRGACEIAAAYVSHNYVAASALPTLIGVVHASLTQLASRRPASAGEPETRTGPSAIQIRQSITPNALVSFIDGRRYKTLKRHLSARGFTPTSYRERFGLPSDYPMVAPNYAKRRSVIAKDMGLGVRSRHPRPGNST